MIFLTQDQLVRDRSSRHPKPRKDGREKFPTFTLRAGVARTREVVGGGFLELLRFPGRPRCARICADVASTGGGIECRDGLAVRGVAVSLRFAIFVMAALAEDRH